MPTQPEAPALTEDTEAWKLFVFRKSRETIRTQTLLAGFIADMQAIPGRSGAALDALVRGGEIETGLTDAGSPAAPLIAPLVDHLAEVACGYCSPDSSHRAPLNLISYPHEIRCSHPEGFSYYGLNPLDFADLARHIAPILRPNSAVIGIRSVGTTLGAVVSAVLRRSGLGAERISVRPEGEPYHRVTRLSCGHENWIKANLQREADFVIVDEGPGFSGSTFLSVTRALEALGVPCSRIVLMGSRPFTSRNNDHEPAEWNRFRRYTIQYASHSPAGSAQCLSDGAWRNVLYPDPSHWPACWMEQERIKRLSTDHTTLFKFQGFGRFGDLVRRQAELLAESGFSPRIRGCEQGYLALAFISGRPLSMKDLNRELLSRMAAYCAFRMRNFAAPGCDASLLRHMAQVNLEIEFKDGDQVLDLEIPVEHPVFPDCRMLPHEWLLASDGRIFKTDAVDHGDGHQLPGPSDIAWDLAGVIIEWKLKPAEAEFFLAEYARRSGDDPMARLSPYLFLYSVLRTAQCRMAAASSARQREGRYLHRQYLDYSQQVKELAHHSLISV
jgi:hypothetical protein